MEKNSSFGRIMEERDNQGFSKILRKEEDLLSETMRGIPYNFIKNMSNMDSTPTIVLNLPWGKSSWPIKISRNSRFYYMEKNGWEKFLSENSLGHDEFLTFTYMGNMHVNVNIYLVDSMEMLKPKNTTNIASSETAESSTTKRSLRSGKKKVETSCLVPDFTITLKKSHLISLLIPKVFAEKHMPKERTKFKIHHLEKKKALEVTYAIVGDGQCRLTPGWVRLARDFGLMVGDVCTFKLIKPNEMVLDVSKETS